MYKVHGILHNVVHRLNASAYLIYSKCMFGETVTSKHKKGFSPYYHIFNIQIENYQYISCTIINIELQTDQLYIYPSFTNILHTSSSHSILLRYKL